MRSAEIIAIKEAVRQRDGFRCIQCGMTLQEHLARYGKTLDVHRLVPGSLYSLEGCQTLCRKCHGPKSKSAKGSLAFVSVKLRPDVWKMAKVICAANEVPVNEYIADLLRPILDEEIGPALDKLAGLPALQ